MPLQPNLIERQLIKRGAIPGLLLDGALSLMAGQAIVAALELEVFEHLRDEPVDIETLADRTDASIQGMENLLRVLTALGYLDRDGRTYRLTDAARRSLPEGDHRLIGAFVEEQGRLGLDAARAVRDAPEDGIIGWETVQSGEVGEGYQETMRWLASDLVDPVVDAVSLPAKARRMLDIGGSHGLYTVCFCEEHPELEGTVLDWPIGLEAARKTLADRPEMADRIDLVERDFEREALPDGYDFAFLGNIVHGLSPEGNRELFGKLAGATTERGMVAIVDQVADPPGGSRLPFNPFDSSFADAVAALIGFNLFLFSGGRSYAYDDLETWLSDAGFSDVSYEPLRQSPGFSLVTARKPGEG
jgi:hypothetical protein